MNTKKVLLSCSILFLTSYSAMAQLYVNEDGNTYLGSGNSSSYALTVFADPAKGHQTTATQIINPAGGHGLEIYAFPSPSFLNYREDILGADINIFSQDYRICAGVNSVSTKNSISNIGSSTSNSTNIGVRALASDGRLNFGICSILAGTGDGAGIYASTNLDHYEGASVQGRWAGYFVGDVKTIGTIYASNITNTSDYRLKENIRELDSKGTMDKLMKMNVVQYNLKNFDMPLSDEKKTVKAFDKESPVVKDNHFGLIAQELKELYPELVVEGQDGYLSVNYIEIIPLLIQSVQELKATVDELQNSSDNGAVKKSLSKNALELETVLYQNNPNPFKENTIVDCFIPQGVSKAELYIYDMNGEQKDCKTIAGRGNVSVTIEGRSLKAGMYLYSLVTDGSVIDTKRMILTK